MWYPEEDIIKILSELPSECSYLDYKEIPYLPTKKHDFIKDLIAMLNSPESIGKKKYIIFGVSNDKQLVGIEKDMQPDDNEFQNWADNITPRPQVQTGTVPFKDKLFGYVYLLDSNDYVVYEVKKTVIGEKKYGAVGKYAVLQGQSFLRRGSRNEVMMQSDREHILEYRKQERMLVLHPTAFPSNCDVSILVSLIGTWDENCLGDQKVVERIYGKDYAVFQSEMRDYYTSNQEVISFSNKVWKLNNRNQMLERYSREIFDEYIENLKAMTLDMISSTDPFLGLVANNLEKEPFLEGGKAESGYKYSDILRKAVFEFWAYAGNNCKLFVLLSKGKIKLCIKEIIAKIINSNNWKILVTNSKMLSLLAESDPETFLYEITNAVKCKDESFYYVLGNGEKNTYINSFSYSLSESLGLLATYRDYFSQAGLCLVALGSMNEVFLDKISIIMLPWYPQTEADAGVRNGFLKAAFIDYPDNAWKLLIKLFPYKRTSSYPVLKAKYLDQADLLCEGVANQDYWNEMLGIVSIACSQAKGDIDKLIDLIDLVGDVTVDSIEEIISLVTEEFECFSDDSRYRIWLQLQDLVHEHKRFSNSEWALSEERLQQIEELLLKFEKDVWFPKERRLFGNDQWKILEDGENYKEREVRLQNEQLIAAKKIYELGDETFFAFLDKIENAKIFGATIADIGENARIWVRLLSMFDCSNQKYVDFATAFVQEAYRRNSNYLREYLSVLDIEKVVVIFENLPITEEAISVIKKVDGKLQKRYWEKVDLYGFQTEDDSVREYVIDNLLKYGRVNDTFRILYFDIENNKDGVSAESVANVLLHCPDYEKISVNSYITEKLINFVEESNLDESQKVLIEWKYLDLITQDDIVYARAIYRQFDESPDEFMKVFSQVHIGESEENMPVFNASVYRLLEAWKTIPGTKKDGSLDAIFFSNWIAKVRNLAEKSKRADVLEHYLGRLFFYAPPSEDGLFIDRNVAKLLHSDQRGDMRNGYLVEAINSRGMHIIDETGSAEFKLEEEYKYKARAVETEGFTRFADTLRMIARKYHDEALYNIEEVKKWRSNE